MYIGAWGYVIFVLFAAAAIGGCFLVVHLQKRKLLSAFPVLIPGFETRMNITRFPPELMARYLTALCGHLHPEYSPAYAKKCVDRLLIEWRPEDPNAPQPRHVKDEWGRWVSGYHQGNRCVVVFREDDGIGSTALGHEIGHELLEPKGYKNDDDEHADPVFPLIQLVDDKWRQARA